MNARGRPRAIVYSASTSSKWLSATWWNNLLRSIVGRLTLKPVEGPADEALVLDPGGTATVGRRSACEFRLHDESVSREHACIEWREVAWFVTDLGSKSGTKLSGKQLAPHKPVILRDRDALQFGRCRYEVAVDDARRAERPMGESRYQTRASIFLRLQDDQKTIRELSWVEFCGRYAPVIVGFARNMGKPSQEADDVLQEVLLAFFQVSPRFEYDPAKGRFRGYLKLITRRAVAESARRAGRAGIPSEDLDYGTAAEQDELWDRLWAEQLFERALEEARAKFEPKTIEAFELFARRDVPADEVAKRLGMSVNSVHHAKSRVMKVIQETVEQIRAGEG